MSFHILVRFQVTFSTPLPVHRRKKSHLHRRPSIQIGTSRKSETSNIFVQNISLFVIINSSCAWDYLSWESSNLIVSHQSAILDFVIRTLIRSIISCYPKCVRFATINSQPRQTFHTFSNRKSFVFQDWSGLCGSFINERKPAEEVILL